MQPLNETLNQAGFSATEIIGIAAVVEDKLQASANEFLIFRAQEGAEVIPLRMGYESTPNTTGDLWHLRVLNGSIHKSLMNYVSCAEATALLRRLPKLPVADKGESAIVRQVTKLLTSRILCAFEPPWPKNDPSFWPQWSRFCLQGQHPAIGVWLNIAITRLKESKAINAA